MGDMFINTGFKCSYGLTLVITSAMARKFVNSTVVHYMEVVKYVRKSELGSLENRWGLPTEGLLIYLSEGGGGFSEFG